MRWLALSACAAIACHPSGRPTGALGTEAGCDSREACRARCDRGETLACDHLVDRLHHDAAGPRFGPGVDTAYQLACHHGSPRGCLTTATIHQLGLGVPADPIAAQVWFDRARAGFAAQCQGGFARGCHGEAEMNRRGRGAAPDLARARALAEQGCRGDDGRSCLLAWHLRARDGDAGDALHAKAVERLSIECERGDLDACAAATHDHDRLRPTTPPPPRGTRGSPVRTTDPGVQCTSDPPDACDRLPELLAGLAVQFVDGVSAELDRDGCDAGNEASCYRLGMAEVGGTGVARDLGRGVARIESACGGGDAAACAAIGRFIAAGVVAGRPITDGPPWQQRACDLGHAGACFELGVSLFDGTGPFARPVSAATSDEVPRGLTLIERACDLDLGAACAHLGRIHYNGWSVPEDRELGRRWLRVACIIGGPDECEAERAHAPT